MLSERAVHRTVSRNPRMELTPFDPEGAGVRWGRLTHAFEHSRILTCSASVLTLPLTAGTEAPFWQRYQ